MNADNKPVVGRASVTREAGSPAISLVDPSAPVSISSSNLPPPLTHHSFPNSHNFRTTTNAALLVHRADLLGFLIYIFLIFLILLILRLIHLVHLTLSLPPPSVLPLKTHCPRQNVDGDEDHCPTTTNPSIFLKTETFLLAYPNPLILLTRILETQLLILTS